MDSFDPIAIVGRIPLILLANKDVPINTVTEFVAAIKARPEQYSYASFGSGTTSPGQPAVAETQAATQRTVASSALRYSTGIA